MNNVIKFIKIFNPNHWLDRIVIHESIVIGGAAVAVGLLGGIGVWLFKQIITLIQSFAFTSFGGVLKPLGGWTVALIPILGGLVVGLIMYYFVGKERYHGLPGIIEACALAGGRLPVKKAPIRVIAAALSIGVGASVGPEDPSVQIGANLGSWFGQILRLPEDRTRALVAGGAAAGIAAAFNAPIAGVFFALEVLLGELSSSSFGFVAVAAVISAVFTQAVSGAQPAFVITPYSFNSILELPFYFVLGILAGPLAALYNVFIRQSRQIFGSIPIPAWTKPALGGLLVGVTGIFLPQIFGVGYGTIGTILSNSSTPIMLLCALLIAKLVLTPVSIGSGFMGGVFAPALFLGATLGGAFGQLINLLFPAMNISAPAYAMVGMAAVLAGAVHAPLTAILLLFEMTNDYRIILPLMFAVAISFAISRAIQKDSVYILPLVENGIQLEKGRDVEVLEGIAVEEVMSTDVDSLNEDDPVTVAMNKFTETGRHGFPVINNRHELTGMLTIQDIKDVSLDENLEVKNVGNFCARDLVTVFPDETISNALRKMGIHDIGRVPVVSRDNPTQLVGILHRSDIVHAYNLALVRRASFRHRTHEVKLGILSGLNVHEIIIPSNSLCVGKHIFEIQWPQSSVISTIRRGRNVILPHGDTMIKEGDVLVVVTKDNGLDELKRLCEK